MWKSWVRPDVSPEPSGCGALVQLCCFTHHQDRKINPEAEPSNRHQWQETLPLRGRNLERDQADKRGAPLMKNIKVIFKN